MADGALQTAAAFPVATAPRAAWEPGGCLLLDIAGPWPPAPSAGPAELRLGGAVVMPPLAWLDLGARRLLVAFAPAGAAPGAVLELRGALPCRATLEAPGLAPLLGGLAVAERAALLRRLLAAAPVFRAQRDPRFANLCRAVAAGLPARAATPLAGDARLALWRLPEPAAAGAWRLLSAGAPLRSVAAPEAGQRLLLLDAAPGALLLPPAGAPIALPAPSALPSLHAVAHRAEVLAALARQPDPAPLRAAQLLAPAAARALADPALPVGGALEAAVSDGAGGLFLRGWLRDPLGLVTAMALRGPGGALPLPAAALHRLPRPDLAEALRRAPQGDGGPRPGFVAHLPAAALPAAQIALELRLGAGTHLLLPAPPGLLPPERARELVLAAVDPALADDALLDACLSPAVERLQAAAMAPGAPAEQRGFGMPPARPAVSLVIPLWRNLSFLSAQVAAFARDPALRSAEILYVLDSPEQAAEVAARLAGLSLLHGIGLRLLVQDRNRGYASACNAGAAAAQAPLLLFLNSDVLPEAPGWLAPLRRALARDARVAAAGPKLLFPDGAIQHAGMAHAPLPGGGWGCAHPFKGWPRHHPPACRARRVAALTGAALLVRRAAFEDAGGFDTGYVLGDFEDSDLCLTLRAAGNALAYVPAAELVHLERQSIATHPGHAGTLAHAHNRRRHERRWAALLGAAP
jgi:GT2 family glycosyltransferase